MCYAPVQWHSGRSVKVEPVIRFNCVHYGGKEAERSSRIMILNSININEPRSEMQRAIAPYEFYDPRDILITAVNYETVCSQ